MNRPPGLSSSLTVTAVLLAAACHTTSPESPCGGLGSFGGGTRYAHAQVDGLRLFYREAGEPGTPTILLLHGYPSSSHMYRDLIPKLADQFHLVAPDYPGFGLSEAPPPERGSVTFERITDAIEHFVEANSLGPLILYMQDFGGPVGLRLAVRHPEWIAGLVVQNANAYEEGLSQTLRTANARRAARADSEQEMQFELGPELALMMYRTGARSPEAMAPEAWTFDDWAMQQPGHRRVAADLLNDYHRNIDLYPQWQAYLRRHHPRTLVLWAKGDPIFLPAGADAYRRDLPDAEVRYFDTSHFALEEDSAGIAAAIKRFFRRT